MDMIKGKEKKKKNFIIKTWQRCRSIPVGVSNKTLTFSRSKSLNWISKLSNHNDFNGKCKTKCQVAPDGCFAVYVGPEKQRFAIKTEYANHPLFEMLLEDAEMEYGYNSEGPILLPCEVDLFYKILGEMEMSGEEIRPRCGFGYVGSSCSPFNSTRRVMSNSENMAKGYGSYGVLTPSRLIQMNQF